MISDTKSEAETLRMEAVVNIIVLRDDPTDPKNLIVNKERLYVALGKLASLGKVITALEAETKEHQARLKSLRDYVENRFQTLDVVVADEDIPSRKPYFEGERDAFNSIRDRFDASTATQKGDSR
jgi:hypothetical protein